MNEERLLGYIKGEVASEAEITEILDWIESSDENQKQYNRLKNLWVITGLHLPGHTKSRAITVNKESRKPIKIKIFKPLMRYAALFILAFGLGSLSIYFISRYQFTKLSSMYNEIVVPYGERSQVSLYDGTKVWLNSGTKFRYPVAFNRKSRNVIVEGEAFFDVATDSKHPFIVDAGNLQIEVHGTRFNVCAYPDDNECFTTLEEGSVFAVNTSSGKGVNLKPGEQLIMDHSTNGIKHIQVNTELFTSWKENLLRFNDTPFEDVIKKMERWYDVKIVVDQSINTKERYTMAIKTESLREMLNLLSKTTKMNYEIKENTVRIKRP